MKLFDNEEIQMGSFNIKVKFSSSTRSTCTICVLKEQCAYNDNKYVNFLGDICVENMYMRYI